MVVLSHHMAQVAVVLFLFLVFMVLLRFFINVCCIGFCLLGEPPCEDDGATRDGGHPAVNVDRRMLVGPDYDVEIAAQYDVDQLLRPVEGTPDGTAASVVCTICQDALYDDSNRKRSATRSCQHVFHDRCIRQWIYQQYAAAAAAAANDDATTKPCRCPNCNEALTPSDGVRCRAVEEQHTTVDA